MSKNSKNIKIIGISPGTRYIGYAIFYGSELRDWGIKNIEGRWSKEKQKRIMAFISSLTEQHKPNALAIKKLHPSRSSPNLNRLVIRIKESSERKRLKVYQHSIKELENFFYPDGRINKKALAEKVADKYSVLSHELKREKAIINPYYIRMFEAVALGSLCLYQLDRHIKTRTSSHHKNHAKKQSKNTCH
jgi:Holliday junction resolvasome RuvABC endonuclease subunit